jgi:Protein of unknown function DUF262/Protein of unknown function (DUF1524)
MSVMDTAPRRLGISQLLEPDHPLKLPRFQRSYAWKEKRQVKEYWDDLKSALDGQGGPLDYFMGLVVIDSDRRIHDGQQRLATTLVFVQELYATAKALAKDDPQHDPDLFDELNAILAPLNSPAKPVLEISATDQAALLNRVGIAAALPESTLRLRAARRKLRELLDEELAPLGTNARLGRILEWAQLLKESAYVVELEVPPQVANSIFETMNTRGVRLSNGDLVKSFLLARAKNINAAQQLWSQIITALADGSGAYEDNLDDFLYHYCGSRYARTSKEQLFRVFSDYTKDVAPLDVLEELRAGAELYAGLIDSFGAPALRDYNNEVKYAIQFLNGAKLRQLRYLLLAVLSDYGSGAANAKKRREMQEDLIVKVAGWSIRGLVDGRTGGQSAQSLYVSAASAIRKGEAKTIADVRKLFTNKRMFIESDGDFEVAFRAQRFDNQQAKAVLYELERAALGRSAALGLREELTLEHVLPQSPEPGTWTQFTADERALYARRLGNMLLLAQPFNSSLGNLEWPDKKKKIAAVKDSQTPFTVAALTFRQWSKNTIDRRTIDLGAAAAAHWPS